MDKLTSLPLSFSFCASLSVMNDNVLPESQNAVAWVFTSLCSVPPVSHNVCKGRMASPARASSVFSSLDAIFVMPATLVGAVCSK